jgi:hypothetical protein
VSTCVDGCKRLIVHVRASNRGLWAYVWLACRPIRAACRSNRPSVKSVCACVKLRMLKKYLKSAL